MDLVELDLAYTDYGARNDGEGIKMRTRRYGEEGPGLDESLI